ncbi:MAG: hypothetical protein ACE5I3_00445 [Phycisphaerae bacterium]
MFDFQGLIFRAALRWPEAMSLVVFGAGLLYMLQGFRFARFLIALSCAGGGLALGGILAKLAGLSIISAFPAAAVLGIVGLVRFRLGLALASAFTLGALAPYLAVQLGLRHTIVLIVAVLGFAIGYTMIWVCRRSLPILVTIVPGAGLLVTGFVGITCALAPSLGLTFLDWATSIPLMVPGLMLMLCILGYSVQANALQGDMETGGSPGLRNLDAL